MRRHAWARSPRPRVKVRLTLDRYLDDTGKVVDTAIVNAASYTADGQSVRADSASLDPVPPSVKQLLDVAETKAKERWEIA